jgi:hypothetical protein
LTAATAAVNVTGLPRFGVAEEAEIAVVVTELFTAFLLLLLEQPTVSESTLMTKSIAIGYQRRFFAGIPTRITHANPATPAVPSHALRLAAEGCGTSGDVSRIAVGVLPLSVVLPELEAGTLVVVPVDEVPLLPSFVIASLQHRSLSPLGEKLVKLIIEADNELLQIERQAIKRIGKPATRRRR